VKELEIHMQFLFIQIILITYPFIFIKLVEFLQVWKGYQIGEPLLLKELKILKF